MKPILTAFSLYGLFAATISAQAYTIDFNSSNLHYVSGQVPLKLTTIDAEYPFRTQYDTTVAPTVRAWQTATTKFEGLASLGMELKSDPACNVKQRVELEFAETHMDEEHYYSFYLFIPGSSGAMDKDTVFTQVWQNHDSHYQSGNYAKFPPLALVLKQNYHWAVETANDQLEPSPSPGRMHDHPNMNYISPSPLAKEQWHRFVIRFKPSVTKAGALKVWVNDMANPVLALTHERNFGYQPGSLDPVTLDSFITRIGLYRGRQACTNGEPNSGNPLPRLNIYVDAIKVGDSFESVTQP